MGCPFASLILTPSACNIEIDAYQIAEGRVIVRTLVNEQDSQVSPQRQPISENSYFYTLEEFGSCLPLGSVSDHSEATLSEPPKQQPPADAPKDPTNAHVSGSSEGMWERLLGFFRQLVDFLIRIFRP